MKWSYGNLLFLFSFALILRLINIFILRYESHGFLIEDSQIYLDSADWLANSGVFLAGPKDAPLPQTERMYGYILLLASINKITAHIDFAAVLFQAVLDSITVCMIARIAARINQTAGLIAGILGCLWFNMILHSGLILNDTLALFFLVTLMLCFLRFLEAPSYLNALFIGGALGGTLAIRLGILPLVPVILSLIVYVFWKSSNCEFKTKTMRSVMGTSLTACVMLLFILPQLVANWSIANRPVLTSQAGTHFLFWVAADVYSDVHGGTRADWAFKFDQELKSNIHKFGLSGESSAFDWSNARLEMAKEKLVQLPIIEVSSVWLSKGILNVFIPSTPFHPLIRSMSNISFGNIESPSLISKIVVYVNHQSMEYIVIFLANVLLSLVGCVFALIGLVISLNKYPKVTAIAAGYSIYIIVLTGPVLGAKYALPIDPILILLITQGFLYLFDNFTSKTKSVRQDNEID